MIAARRRDDAGFRYLAGQQIGEGAAGLERARVLQQFELEGERSGGQAQLAGIDLDRGGAPDIGPNDLLASRNALRRYGIVRSVHRSLPASISVPRGQANYVSEQ